MGVGIRFHKPLHDYVMGYSVLEFTASERDGGEQEMSKYQDALLEIVAQETKSANATVRRMTKIAREALDDKRGF